MTLYLETVPKRKTGDIIYAVFADGATMMGFGKNSCVKVTPNATATFTSTIPSAGCDASLIIFTRGSTPYNITFGTGFKSLGVLKTGSVPNKYFVLRFISDGIYLIEQGARGAAI